MDDNQPGFDVESEDPGTGFRRRIEVKGVQGRFEDSASVVLTATQFKDALRNLEEKVEYWLYIVDHTETAQPRVFPIPWVLRQNELRFGFYASVWATDAKKPAIVTENRCEEFKP